MDRSLPFRTAVAAAAALLLVSTVAATPRGRGKGGDAERSRPGTRGEARVEARVDATLSVGIDFDGARRLAVSHGLTGYDALPPGIRKNLARGKRLPPGIAKRVVPAPMLRDLPEHPGHTWRVCGADLVLVAETSGIVAEVFVDLFR